MKKVKSLFLTLSLMLSLAACGGNAELPDGTAGSQQAESESQDNKTQDSVPSDKPESSDKKTGGFSKNATLEETVMVDEGGVKITATGLNYTDYAVELELIIENNTEKNLSFISGSLGYCCNSVNGYMINSGYLNCDVASGKKANDFISFKYDGLMLYGINEIADMEIGFDISDEDYNDTYTGPRQVKTSAFTSHDYSTDYYQAAIASRAVMHTYGYDIKHFSQDTLYDDNGVKLISSGLFVNRDGDTMLLLELENTTSDMVDMVTSDIALNGLVVESYSLSRCTINPGKRGIVDVNLSDVFATEYWSAYGINEIGSVSLSLSQRDSEGTSITDAVPVEVVVPNVKAEYDSSGEEVYNQGGLSIVAKTILENSSEYIDDLNVLLLAENNSGKTLSVHDVYNSLSVNGFMTDYSYYSKEIENGQSAALVIKLRESSLEDNKIASVSEIKEVEIGFEIKEGYTTIDEAVINIPFN